VLNNAIYNDKKCTRKTSAKITFLNNVGAMRRTHRTAMPGCARQRSATSLSLRAAAAAARVGRPTNLRGAT